MIFDKLFQLMAEKLASDIFISAGAPINIKIQGVTMPINQQVMEPSMIKRMIYEMMTPEQIDTFERVRELNLSFGRRELGNFRVNVFWQRHSIGVVVRYIQGDIPTLESLGLPPVLSEVVTEKRGLVLVVGATGSGKSTTLASMIDHRNMNQSGHILTVEDPIEYLFKHRKSIVNQREVGIDTHSWHDALRNAMRQAPDCILIGEIRDRETMQAALAYSQTGHLCLATLHANNAYHALNRIVNFFPLENRSLLFLDLAVALKCIVSQRLVRKPDGVRVPAVEILMNTRHVADLIERGELNEVKEAMQQSLAPGSQTFEQDLYRLYHEGTVTFEEALANADSPTNLSWLINNAQFDNVPDPRDGSNGPPIVDFTRKEPENRSFSDFALHLDDSVKP
ncbi:PilT/PilU family type 4a pilus ATPase [Aromatoleum bremense]|uniref:PilT/PilU family type 4a pilus ATPase n=1 Tax=Aromatoleum bremense TaxID=76115 RepID=A0ABX1NQ83_9RHOO|nr:PilT/PilU family type 4a pilus ATPase [Aromatoleum bremense]NMG14130.1 PilT/PilU family type 4a pilus ATPase [Aromatoleum bremense]QTQ33908.1 Twitching motility family protein [Aromatoleum bremense]